MMLKRIFALSVLAMGLTACASAPYDHQYDYYNGPDYLYPPGVLPPPPPEHGHKPPPAVRPPMGGAHPPMVSPGAIRPMPRR